MKYILACFVFAISSPIFGQILLSSFDADLKKPLLRQQVALQANRNTGEFYVFTSDKSSLKAIKYNGAIFLRDSLATSRPSEIYDFIAGQCFSAGGNPEVYWMSENREQIIGIQFDFSNRVASTSSHRISYDNENYVSHFSTNDAFYVVTVGNNEAKLLLYEFRSAQITRHEVDLAPTEIVKLNDKPSALQSLLQDHALVLIETENLNPLFYCTAKIKYYLKDGKLFLTADHHLHETLIIEVGLADFKVSHKRISQPLLDLPGKSNSYFLEHHLFQLKVNDQKLVVQTTDYNSGKSSILIEDDQKSAVNKNSPFLSQTGRQSSRQIKNTERFLRAMSSSLPGISVYQAPDAKLMTIGGISYVASGSDILMGVATGVGMVLSGSDLYLDGLIPTENLRTVFYETHFNEKNEFVPMEPQILAADKLSMFFDEQKGVSLISIVPYNGYFIAGYYIDKEKKFYLRKFTDGYQD